MTPTGIRDLARASGWRLRDPVDTSGTPSGPWVLDRDDGTGTVYQWDGETFDDGTTVDLAEQYAARLKREAERADKSTAKEAFARLGQIIDADPTNVTNRQVVAAVQDIAKAVQDIAKMVRALGRRELAD